MRRPKVLSAGAIALALLVAAGGDDDDDDVDTGATTGTEAPSDTDATDGGGTETTAAAETSAADTTTTGAEETGAGMPGGSPELAALLTRSPDAAAEAGSVAFTMAMDVPVPAAAGGTGAPVTLTGQGGSSSDGRLQMTLDLSAFNAAAPPDRQLPADQLQAELLFDGATIYLRFPALAAQVGTEWVSADLAALSGMSGVDLSALVGAAGADPTATLAQLRGVGDVTEVGPEEVRGAATTHYHAVVDLQAAIEALPAEARAAMEASVEQYQALLGTTEIEVDVWLDADGRPARIVEVMPFPAGAGQPPLEATLTMELFDWGTPVTITPPPADQVTDLSQVVGGAATTTTAA
jgi:hypothetical protein